MPDGDRRAAHAPAMLPGLPAGTRLRTLRGLAAYRCGHSGSCCRAGWPIPVEVEPLAVLKRAHDQGRLLSPAAPWLEDDRIIGRTAEKQCVFLDKGALLAGSGGCRVESTLGVTALPYSCRQFPRLLLADNRGWHMTLSAWCPTAARMLVEGDASDASGAEFLSYDHIDADSRVHLEYLDARDAWPPLLRPGVLAGLATYDDWECRVLTAFLGPVATRARSLGDAVLDLVRWTEWLRDWRPADGALQLRVARPWRAATCMAGRPQTRQAVENMLDDLINLVPKPWRPLSWPDGVTDAVYEGVLVSRQTAEAALARYLGARLIGSWIAYQGEGLRSVTASIVSAYASAVEGLRRTAPRLVTVGHLTSAVRAADWLLLHLVDRADWARWCADTEADRDAGRLVALVHAANASVEDLPWAR